MRTRWLLAWLLGVMLLGSQVATVLADGFEGGDPHGKNELHENPNADKHELGG